MVWPTFFSREMTFTEIYLVILLVNVFSNGSYSLRLNSILKIEAL